MRSPRSKDFLRDTRGNFAIISALSMVPLLIASGLLVDYSMGVNNRSEMQGALDSAAFAALNMPDDAAKADRERTLQETYAANGGLGTASMNGDVVNDGGAISLKVNANYQMPTSFMRIVGTNTVDIAATSAVRKPLQLMKATFKLEQVTGIWSKSVTLMGRKAGEQTYNPLVQMNYVYNMLGQSSDKGVGTTTLSMRNGSDWTPYYQIKCETTYLADCQPVVMTGDGSATVDVSDMDALFLQMDISANNDESQLWLDDSSTPRTIRSDDPDYSDRMFVNGDQMPKGKAVDIYTAIGCGNVSEQRWEDGGGHEGKSAWDGTDFWYQVTGQCSSNGNRRAILTQ